MVGAWCCGDVRPRGCFLRETQTPGKGNVGMCDTTRDSAEPSPSHAATEHAFTLVELLVVLAILCLMAITIIISLSSIA